jgi:glyoxylase-like metal-dependent hydrolase (beta-lactamase superfamily II)
MRATAIACVAVVSQAPAAVAEPAFNPANTVRLEPDHPNSYQRFAPELPQTLARTPAVDPDTGIHVGEIEPGLFFVTDLIYQSAFLATDAGVVVFDAPPSFADRLRPAIEAAAPGAPVTHLVLSHGHADHAAGSAVFADVPGLTVIAASEVAESLQKRPHPGIVQPTRTFDEALSLSVGGVAIELRTARFHAEDQDTIIHLPDRRFLMAVDTITPGEAPFMNFGATTDVNAYFEIFEELLAYDFEHFLSGHVSTLGTRQDVIEARDYAFDVRDTVARSMASFQDRFMETFVAFEFENPNLAYRHAIETVRDECARAVIDRWEDTLSAVDVWASSHCELTVLYSIMH